MIRAIIVDDEVAAIGNLADLLHKSGGVETVGEFTNPLEALDKMSSLDIDVAFLDIEMPGMDGLALANRFLDLNSRIKVVFVTAYNEYAVEAFELHALDYLLKPVTRERFQKTLDRVTVRKEPRIRHRSRLSVNCFGNFRVENEDGTSVKWRTSKTEELLAYLIDKNGLEARRETIIDVLWSHMDEKRAATNFSTCLYNMRKTLADLGYPELLFADQNMFRLDIAQISSDVQKFERCVSHANQIDESNYRDFIEVIASYGEGYMASNYYDWAENKRRQMDEAFSLLIVQAANYALSMGREPKAAEMLKKGLLKDPLHPGLNHTMLKLYVKMKDRIAAMKHYESYSRRLEKELGLKPDAAMEQLIKSLRSI